MRLEHLDYIKLVIDTYNKKRANNELSPLLAQSTPANIRRECLNVYQERYQKKDEQVLRAFFGPTEHGRQFLQAIREFETDKFRPLDNYLKGSTEKTDDRNLELLAWLINFKHRPYVFGVDVILSEDELLTIDRYGKETEENEAIKEEERSGTKVEEEKTYLNKENSLPTPSINKGQGNKLKKRFALFLIGATCLGGIYFIWKQERNRQIAFGNANTGCMYWKDDHYEAMPCNEERKGLLKLAMDTEKVKSFKRIIQEDTITEKSIGKVHYIKIDGRIEYYTADGNHPIEVTRTLRPLSPYMFNKYLRKQESENKDSVVSDQKIEFVNKR